MPTPSDKKFFHDLIDGNWAQIRQKYPTLFYNNGNLIWGKAPNGIRAFRFFVEKISRYVRFGIVENDGETPSLDELFAGPSDADQRRRIDALLDSVLNQLKIVVITLDEGDDAQVIFETLNSKAEPLLAMDLVKNNIFHRATTQQESVEELFESKWRIFDDDRFWKEDSPRAKPRRPRIDHFLSHCLTAQTGDEVSLRELYAEYRAFTRPKGHSRFATVSEELDALLQFAPIYRELEEARLSNRLASLGNKLATWEVATAYPLVFCIAISTNSDQVKAELYQLIYSYIVRRAICGLTAKNLNKNFQRITGLFLKGGVSVESFRVAFSDQTGPAVRFPTDGELVTAIERNPIYTWMPRKDRLADILWELEIKSRSKFQVNTQRPNDVSVEHVMPQTWTTHWPLPDGRQVPSDKITGADSAMRDAISVRDNLLHTLGNLTLVTVPANSKMSYAGFGEKRNWLQQSLLALNTEICQTTGWDEGAIVARSRSLADRAVEIWPGVSAS